MGSSVSAASGLPQTFIQKKTDKKLCLSDGRLKTVKITTGIILLLTTSPTLKSFIWHCFNLKQNVENGVYLSQVSKHCSKMK